MSVSLVQSNIDLFDLDKDLKERETPYLLTPGEFQALVKQSVDGDADSREFLAVTLGRYGHTLYPKFQECYNVCMASLGLGLELIEPKDLPQSIEDLKSSQPATKAIFDRESEDWSSSIFVMRTDFALATARTVHRTACSLLNMPETEAERPIRTECLKLLFSTAREACEGLGRSAVAAAKTELIEIVYNAEPNMYSRTHAPKSQSREDVIAFTQGLVKATEAVLQLDKSSYRLAKVRNLQGCQQYRVLGLEKETVRCFQKAAKAMEQAIKENPSKKAEWAFDVANFSNNAAVVAYGKVLPDLEGNQREDRVQEIKENIEKALSYADSELARNKPHPYFTGWFLFAAKFAREEGLAVLLERTLAGAAKANEALPRDAKYSENKEGIKKLSVKETQTEKRTQKTANSIVKKEKERKRSRLENLKNARLRYLYKGKTFACVTAVSAIGALGAAFFASTVGVLGFAAVSLFAGYSTWKSYLEYFKLNAQLAAGN